MKTKEPIDLEVTFCVGEWLPSDYEHLKVWLNGLIKEVEDEKAQLLPVIEEFKEFIENDVEIHTLFTYMFKKASYKHPYDPTSEPQIKDYNHFLEVINKIIRSAPEYNGTSLVGFPINAILNWPMGTMAGFSAFLNKKVNQQLKKILNQWALFLSSKESCYVLSNDKHKGWFGEDAKKKMPNFEQMFKCDPTKPHYGFNSWDEFFTREFKDNIRPVEYADDHSIITNCCESRPFKIQYNVNKKDHFWIKSQPYSLVHMLAGDPLVEKFVGGTVYQAFLDALSYHRWHSPVTGKVIKTSRIDGTYYSELYSKQEDEAAPNNSQGYIAHVATRGLIFIEPDNPKIGLVCIVQIGMAEVSSCEITVYEGQHVKKGDQIGMFHFGGSTYCLIFENHVKLKFNLHNNEKPSIHAKNINVNAHLATVLD